MVAVLRSPTVKKLQTLTGLLRSFARSKRALAGQEKTSYFLPGHLKVETVSDDPARSFKIFRVESAQVVRRVINWALQKYNKPIISNSAQLPYSSPAHRSIYKYIN